MHLHPDTLWGKSNKQTGPEVPEHKAWLASYSEFPILSQAPPHWSSSLSSLSLPLSTAL